MSKVNLNDLVNLQNETTAVTQINSNSHLIETGFENTLSRDGTQPNSMNARLDMNSNRILNLPQPIDLHEPARLVDINYLAGIPASTTVGPIQFFGTRADAIATAISPAITRLLIDRYTAASGLSPAYYQPGTSGGVLAFRDNNGTGNWWELEPGQYRTFEMFGAYGDGNQDDTSAIQAAIGNGNVIIAGRGPDAIYKVSMSDAVTCINLKSNIIIDGRGSTIRKAASAWVNNSGFGNLVVGDVMLANGSALSPMQDIHIHNLNIDGNASAMTSVPGPYYAPDGVTIINPNNFQEQSEHNGISLNFVTRGSVQNCWVYRCGGTAITCGGSHQIVFKDNWTYENGKCGIYISNLGSDVVVDGNHDQSPNFNIFSQGKYWSGALGAAYGSIHVMHDNVRVSDNECTGGGFGIYLGFTGGVAAASAVSERLTVTGNIIRDVSQYGMWVTGLTPSFLEKRISITGNEIQGAGLVNLLIQNCKYATVTGNIILDSGGFGVDIGEGSSDITVTGNTISANATSGIRLSGCIGGNISGNTISSNSAFGIDWAGTTSTNTDNVIGLNTYRNNASGNVSSSEITSGSNNTIKRIFRFTTDIGSVPDGTTVSVDYTCEGVRLGSSIVAGLSSLTGRWVVNPMCLTAGTIKVYYTNNTGGAVDPPSGTLTLDVTS